MKQAKPNSLVQGLNVTWNFRQPQSLQCQFSFCLGHIYMRFCHAYRRIDDIRRHPFRLQSECHGQWTIGHDVLATSFLSLNWHLNVNDQSPHSPSDLPWTYFGGCVFKAPRRMHYCHQSLKMYKIRSHSIKIKPARAFIREFFLLHAPH